ncbi:MAG TPA: DUF2721 domain-containing protein [Ignavibacteriaceae bacterium]|nr:DUF2721 domain-containing protein [Ignavibacteriaceae bacterium]
MISNSSIAQIIQLMLAPGLMISACGLLLLGMNNKYSLVVNRIRLLNEERRKFLGKNEGKDFNYDENVRLESISMQIAGLLVRVKYVRNAVLSYTIAVAFFVVTSLLIGLQLAFKEMDFTSAVTVCFLLGMVSVVTGIIYAAYETKKGYDIIHLEVKIDE